MNAQKFFIKNRKGENISVFIETSEHPRGLVFVMHGLSGFKEQPHITLFAEAFKEKGFTVVRFDTTNTLGESDGKYENATVTNYYEDLEDVIQWANQQPWYQEPFALAGHSLGGICTALYAERHPEKVLALAPISTVISGKHSIEAHSKDDPEQLAQWEKTGWKEDLSRSRPGLVKRLPWSHMIDRVRYDLLPDAHKLTMPVLLIVGENDSVTPPHHIRIFFDALPGPKEYHIIPEAPHTFRDEKHLSETKKIFLTWINTWLH